MRRGSKTSKRITYNFINLAKAKPGGHFRNSTAEERL
jgi:hypothetical protein